MGRFKRSEKYSIVTDLDTGKITKKRYVNYDDKSNYIVRLCSLLALFILLGSYFFTGVFSNNYTKVKQNIYYRTGQFESLLNRDDTDWQTHYSGYQYKIENKSLYVSGYNSNSYFSYWLFSKDDYNGASNYIGLTYNTNQTIMPQYGQYYIYTDIQVVNEDNTILYLDMTSNDTIYFNVTDIKHIALYFPQSTGIDMIFSYNYYECAIDEYVNYDWTYKLNQLDDLKNVFDSHLTDINSTIGYYNYDFIDSMRFMYVNGFIDFRGGVLGASNLGWYLTELGKTTDFDNNYDSAIKQALSSHYNTLLKRMINSNFSGYDNKLIVHETFYAVIETGELPNNWLDNIYNIITMPFYWVGNLIYDIGVFVRFVVFW